MSTRKPVRSTVEWLELIIQCRQSGLFDSMWCEQHSIPASTFYNAETRLRKMACTIPAPSKGAKISMDLTAKQEVVQIDVVPNPETMERSKSPVSALRALPEYLDNSHMIEIIIGKPLSGSAEMLILILWKPSSAHWGRCHVCLLHNKNT